METRGSPDLECLQRLAKQVQLANYESLPKSQLFQVLKDNYDLDRLMRTEQRAVKKEKQAIERKKRARGEEQSGSSSSSAAAAVEEKKARPAPLNKLDPIMLCKIRTKKSFIYRRLNGTAVRFNLETLIDYMISSGEFSDPQTRTPFSDEDLAAMDEQAIKMKLNKPSVVEAKKNVNNYSNAKFRRDALLAIERCAGDVVTEMLNIAETYDPDEGQIQLVSSEFPTFSDLFRQMKDADPEYASKCLAQWQQFIKGPPNRPNYDEYGLIKVVSIFLRTCAN